MRRLLCPHVNSPLQRVSLRELEKVYRRLDIAVHKCGKSFYNDNIPALIAEFGYKFSLLS